MGGSLDLSHAFDVRRICTRKELKIEEAAVERQQISAKEVKQPGKSEAVDVIAEPHLTPMFGFFE